MKWPTVAIGEIAQQVRGVSYDKGQASNSAGVGLKPVLRAGNIQDGSLLLGQDLVFVPDSCIAPQQLLRPGDIVVAASSGSLDVVGKAAQLRESWEGSFGAFCKVVRPASSEIDPRYLHHFFQSSGYRRKISSLAAGANINNLRNEHIDDLQIPLPPLEEQRRIAATLDKAHEIKAKAAKRTILISSLSRSLFVRRFGLPSENPQNLKIHRLVDVCRPKQWPTISSKQLQDHGYPVFGANGLIGYFDRFNHSKSTVLVTCRGATCGTVNISPPNCYVTGNSMAMDDPDPSLLTTDYLAWVLRLRGMYDVISGSAQPQITRQGLEAVTIPVPPIEAQNEFSNELMAISGISESSQNTEDSLAHLTNSLASALIEN